MFGLSDAQSVGAVVIFFWIVIGCLWAKMGLEWLRRSTRMVFVSRNSAVAVPASSSTPSAMARGNGKTLRGRPAFEGRSRSVPQ